MRAVNLGTRELRVSVQVRVLEDSEASGGPGVGAGDAGGTGGERRARGRTAALLGAHWVGGGGVVRVPGGAYRRLRVTCTPRRPLVLRAVLTMRAHIGAARLVPITATPQASHLHVSVVEDGGLSEGAVWPATSVGAPRGEAWVELGPTLVGAMLRRVLRLCSERTYLTYIILALDEGDYFDLQWVCETSPSGWVRAGEFALWPRCVRVRACVSAPPGPPAPPGPHAPPAPVRVRVRPALSGSVRGAVRLAAPGGAARMLHLHAYAMHFHPRHITIETKEEDFGIMELSNADESAMFHLLLRATTPGVPQGDLVLVNKSCLWYRWHWVLHRAPPAGHEANASAAGEEQSAVTSESAVTPRAATCQRAACPRVCDQPPRLVSPPEPASPPPPHRRDVTDLMTPPAGVAPPHSRTHLHLALPPPAHDPIDIRLILEDIPRASFLRNYVPDIEYTTFEPNDESGILGGYMCAVRAGMIRTRAVMTSRRALLLPPALMLHHSYRVCAVPLQFRCVFVRAASDDYTRVPCVPPPAPRRVVWLTRRAPCVCEPQPCACEPTLQEALCDKPRLDHVTVYWEGGQVCSGRVGRRACPRSPRLAPPRAPRPARACPPPPSPLASPPACPPTCAPCPPCRVVLPALAPGASTATTLHLHNDTYQPVECLLDVHWVSLGVTRCTARGAGYSLASREAPLPPRPPCSRACEAGRDGRCECRCMLPRSCHLRPGASAKLLVSYSAPEDGCRLALVWSRRADVAGLAAVWHRATLLSARAAAPRLAMQVRPLTGAESTWCGVYELGGGGGGGTWRRVVRGSVRVGAALRYTLRVHNVSPTPTTLKLDPPLDEDEFMKITFEPNEVDIEGYSKTDIRVTLTGLRACERRVRVRRARARHHAQPLYVIVDADVTGVEVTYEIPMGNGPRADLTIFRAFERASCALWAPEWARALLPPAAVFYRDEQLAVSQQYEVSERPPCTCVLPAPHCTCVQRARRHANMQLRRVPLYTECRRTLVVLVRGPAHGVVTWRADVATLPPPPPAPGMQLTLLLHKGEWELPGAWLWVTSQESSDGDVTRLELTLHFRAHCWGVYRDYLAIQVVGVEPLVVRLWAEAVGASPARLLAASPPRPPVASPPCLLTTCPPANVLDTTSAPDVPRATGDLTDPYLLWITPGEGPRLLRVKNDSPATLHVQVFLMQAYQVDEDGCAPRERPFRLLYRLEDAAPDSSCWCPEGAPCLSSGSLGSFPPLPALPPSPPPPAPAPHDLNVPLALGPDWGEQGDCRFQVEPSYASLPGYGITEFSVIENPDSESETDTIIFIQLTPVQEHGEWWSRPPPAWLCARVPPAPCHRVRAPRPALVAAPNELCLAADAFQLQLDKLNIVAGSVAVRTLWCGVVGSARASPSPPWRLRAPAHKPAAALPVLLPAHATLLVEVECCIDAQEVWAAEERRMSRTSLATDTTRDMSRDTPRDRTRDRTRDKARERLERLRERELARDAVWDTAPDALRDLRDGLLRFYDNRDTEILRVPMSLSLHFPQLLMFPARLALPPTAAAVAEDYFTITHTYKYPMEIQCSVEGDEMFSLEPTSMVLAPNEAGILYVKFRTEWNASLPVGEPSWTWSLLGETEPVSLTCRCCEEQERDGCPCADETRTPSRERSHTDLTQTLAGHGQLHSCRVTAQSCGRGGVVRRALRYVTAVCSRDRAAAPRPNQNYYTAPPPT